MQTAVRSGVATSRPARCGRDHDRRSPPGSVPTTYSEGLLTIIRHMMGFPPMITGCRTAHAEPHPMGESPEGTRGQAMELTTGQGRSRASDCNVRRSCPTTSWYQGVGGVSPEVAKPVPLHLGQTTKPFRLLLAQTLHVPMTTQDSLRASPVPLHSGHATSRFPAQRGHCSLTSPTGIPPSCPIQSSTDAVCAQSAVSADRLYVILAARTTPCPFLTARGLHYPPI